MIGDSENGIYMYVEGVFPSRYCFDGVGSMSNINDMKPLNAQGNYDYTHTEYPKLDPNNSNWLDSRYMWNNPIHTFTKHDENPIGGINPWFRYFNDIHKYKDLDKDGKKEHVSDPNHEIDTYRNSNDGIIEGITIHNEMIGGNEVMTYAGTYGRNAEAIAAGKRSDAFQVGDEVSLSGIVPILNTPNYNTTTARNEAFAINGIKVEILSKDPVTGAITVHIELDDYEINENKRWCTFIDLNDNTGNSSSDLILKSGKTLTIDKSGTPNTHIETSDEDFVNLTEFTLKSNSTFEIESGAECLVDANSTFIMEPNSKLLVREGGLLTINPDADFDFNGGNIILEGDNSCLEIIGELYIADNQTFTYTGDGYIKFSNPGGDATNNIFCGTGASIVLQGSGQNDKIMEVQQSSVRFPAELSSFELRDGKIEMGANARLLNEVVSGNENYPITLDNIKITSDNGTNNNHRSYVFWGQPNITINDCMFEYGQYGLYNYTYWGSPLTVTNSTFRDNQTGLYMYDKGLTLTNCIFDDNTQVGLHADNMSFVSGLSNCKFNNNYEGIVYQGSSNADLNLSTCEILDCDSDGIVTTGGFDLDLNCTWVRNNQDGISTTQGTRVDIANNAKNDLSGNDNAIRLDYGFLSANNGYNKLTSNNYAVRGETPLICLIGFPTNLYAEHNTWDAYNNPPTYLQYHKLWVMNCNRTPVNIIDTDPDDIFCYHIIFIGRDLESGIESVSNNDILLAGELNELSAQVDNLELSMQEANTATICQQLLSESITLMENVYGIETAETYYQSKRIWSNIHNIIDKHYEIIGRDDENLSFNQSVDQVMQLNEQLMLDADAIAYYEYALDNALLERLRGNFDESLLLLDNLIPELEGMDKETAYVNRWICHIEAEREAALRNITPEEFMDAVAICNTDYENALESLSDNLEPDESAEETSTAPEIHIVPNPNNGNFTLEISECTEGSSVRISNVYSQPVFTQTFTESGTQTVQITGLSQGHYTVYYLENNIVISSESIVVE